LLSKAKSSDFGDFKEKKMAGIGTTVKKIIGILLIVVGSALLLMALGWIILCLIVNGKIPFWVILSSLVFIVPGLLLASKGKNILEDSEATYVTMKTTYNQISDDLSASTSTPNRPKSRENSLHTCSNCSGYSYDYGWCRDSGHPKTAGDSCSNWH
jgi:hypothetical protein